MKKHCVAKILQAIWAMFLHENNRHYNPYRFSYNFFYTLFTLSYKPRIWFSASWWSSNEKYFCFLFISSRTLLQNHGEFNRLLQMNFFTCYSCLYCSSVFISISCSSQNVKRYPGQRICFSKDSDMPLKKETPVCMCS